MTIVRPELRTAISDNLFLQQFSTFNAMQYSNCYTCTIYFLNYIIHNLQAVVYCGGDKKVIKSEFHFKICPEYSCILTMLCVCNCWKLIRNQDD